MMKKLRTLAATGGLLLTLSAPSHAFFNPFGIMGSMMGQMAQPVTGQMIGQMMGAMQGMMHSNEFRNDMALFILGTADEMLFEVMQSLQNGEETFVGAFAENMLTNGAPRGSVEYNQAMGYWMEVFAPAMAARMEKEAVVEDSLEDLRQEEIARRNELRVFIKKGAYNWDTHSYDPDWLAYYDNNGKLVAYEPLIALPGDPGYEG
jgi:hypothetical protein